MISKFQRLYRYKAIYTISQRFILKKPLEKLTRERAELIEKEARSSKEIFSTLENKNELNKINDKTDITLQEKQIAKEIFYDAMDMYLMRYGKNRRGHIQFINQCLAKIKQYKINDELDIYKKILEIFPEEIFIPISITQVEFEHFPLQQDTCIDILCAMEANNVIPDDEFAQLLYKRFGLHTSPMTRLQRMLYWMPKIRNLNPWPKPERLPYDKLEIAKLAIERMSLEKDTAVTVHEVPLSLTSQEKSWFVASQSLTQRKLLKYYYEQQQRSSTGISQDDNQQDKQRILFVDGPYVTWLKRQKLEYFILNTELDKDRLVAESNFTQQFDNYNGIHDSWYTIFGRDSEFPSFFDCDEFQLSSRLTKFENALDNRAILATCIPAPSSSAIENGSKGSMVELKSWISMLCLENRELNQMKVVFRINYPIIKKNRNPAGNTEKSHVSEDESGE